jgi:hypothetical protein
VCNVLEDIHSVLTGQSKFIEYDIDVRVRILEVKVRCPVATHYNTSLQEQSKAMH